MRCQGGSPAAEGRQSPPHRLVHAGRHLAPDAVARCRCTAHFSCRRRRLSLGHHLARRSVGEGIQRRLVGARPHNAAVGRDAQRRRGHTEALPRERLGVVLRDVDPAPADGKLNTSRDRECLLLQCPLPAADEEEGWARLCCCCCCRCCCRTPGRHRSCLRRKELRSAGGKSVGALQSSGSHT